MTLERAARTYSEAKLLIITLLLPACGPGVSGDPTMTVSSVSERPDIKTSGMSETAQATPVPTYSATTTSGPEKSSVGLDGIARDLQSPDVRLRLLALEAWGQQAPPGSVAPFMLALNDPDEQVRASALALIEQDWVRQRAMPYGR